jgi:hypothetical protein
MVENGMFYSQKSKNNAIWGNIRHTFGFHSFQSLKLSPNWADAV